jgi:hypothetical protein
MQKTRPVTVSNAEILRELDERTAGADDARLDRLVALQKVGTVRNALLERELKRLTQKHGDDHPLVTATAARLQAGNASLRALGFEIERTSLNPPAPSAEAWTVFGIVRAMDGTPFPGVAVAVVDAKGAIVAPEKLVPTEKDGAFSIRLAPPVRQPRKTTAAQQKEPEQQGDAGSVHLEVFRSGTNRVAVDTVQFQPAPGVVDYREIVVAQAPDNPCAK